MENRKTIILSIVAVVILITFVLGATYAYFMSQGNISSNTDIRVTTYTSDLLTFNIEKDLNLSVTQPMLSSENKSVSTTKRATAILKANSKTNEATAYYYFYILITENELQYTKDKSNPELILSITGPDGEVTKIENLEYKSVQDVQKDTIEGFDITNKKGLFKVAYNKEIKAIPSEDGYKEDVWNITLTFVNLNSNQNKNTGKIVNGKIMMQSEKIIENIGDVCNNNELLSDCIIKLNNNNTDTWATNILHHNENLENGANDNSYRYLNSNPANYICFGSTETPCPANNLYRIIGLIDNKIKLIKADYANSDILGTDGEYTKSTNNPTNYYKGDLENINKYYWNSTGKNTWNNSKLNTINLNKNFYNSLAKNWQNLISTTTWQVGGNKYDDLIRVPIKTTYQNEIINQENATTYDAKIGLIYVSDYGYASSQDLWHISFYSYNIPENWIYMGMNEWTITRITDDAVYSLLLTALGNFEVKDVAYNHPLRPVFNLVSNIKYQSGMGTKSDPIIIES